MSYILDALKRSEQERHQEHVSNLSSDMILLPTKQNKSHLWPYLLILILTINIGVYSYFNLNKNPIITQKNSVFAEVIKESKEEQTVAPSRVRVRDSSIDTLNDRPIPAHLSQRPVIKKIVNEGTYVDGGILIEPKHKTQWSPEVRKLSIIDSIPKKKLATTQAKSDPVTIKADPFENITRLSDLSLQFQRSIPALAFNSHIYSDVPSARRVMINGLYLREGDGLAGMTLIEIGEFYILLDKNGQQFKLPALRDWQTP